MPDVLILEEASLELVPRRFWNYPSVKSFKERFGVEPQRQILDDNFHHDVVKRLQGSQKRGRPDVVHFTLLDVVSTPLFFEDKIRVIVHTINLESMELAPRVRLPRTLHRFCGVMSKVLSGSSDRSEGQLIRLEKNVKFEKLLESLSPSRTITFTREGIMARVDQVVERVRRMRTEGTVVWVIGGFPHGHFKEDVKSLSDDLVAISSYPLAGHVVSARLSYELEKALSAWVSPN